MVSPMRDSISLGFAPSLELQEHNCCEVFLNQIIRTFGNPPESTILTTDNHGVICYFDMEKSNFAFNVEKNIPQNWDELSLLELN